MEAGNKRPTAQVFKDKGNEAFKKADFRGAVEHYTSAIKADPSDHILPCNRAFARLKLQQWKLAEADCTRSLELLPEPNCKALFRRGTARRHQNKWDEALQDLKAALALEPNNASICAELQTVKAHLQQKPTTTKPPPSSSKASSSISFASSDSETSSQPIAGPSSSPSTTLQDGQSSESSTNLLREVSTTRFTSSDPYKSAATGVAPTNSFSDLKQIRQKKEEKSSGFMTTRIPNKSIPSPEPLKKSNPSSSTNSIPPVRSFTDFEMRWCISSQPEVRFSVLEALDRRHVAQLFGEHLEPETLEQMIDAMEVPLRSNDTTKITRAVELLQGLDNVSRMKTLTMFLAPDHQKVIQDLLIKFHSFGGKSVVLNNWSL
ncbi:hypothetical protein PtA15_11A171 [Puccinia triticina]|uniref:RNA polymerase II-associated protein 3 n=1 Tax=Puccinia triticina TaxID=208348 RepID=A0ABY7CYG7_9BASI|nr:uncharacterized protein PtA15_11A171 [Puccinia triticina]WAQ89482.1 hypothetical protein PtA15_11A171 [Puccinia triticina]